jgi:hypothetical protein
MELKMSTVQVNGSGVTATSTNNNGGAAINIGSSATLLDNRSLGNQAQYATSFPGASGVPYDNNSPIAIRYTTTLAGSANTFLRSGASDSSDTTIHRIESIRTRRFTTAIRNGTYNVYTNTFSTPVSGSLDSFGTDDASRPTLAVPGELTYKTGAKIPVNDEYAKKTV